MNMDMKCPRCGWVPTGPKLYASGTMVECENCHIPSYFDAWRMSAISALHSQLKVMERDMSSKLEKAMKVVTVLYDALQVVNKENHGVLGYTDADANKCIELAEWAFPELSKEK